MKKVFKIDGGRTWLSEGCAESYIESAMETFKMQGKQLPEVKVFTSANIPLGEIPEDIQENVRSTLRAYDRCHVSYGWGHWTVTAGIGIGSNYPGDHFVAGTYYAKDVYTEEERMEHLDAMSKMVVW